jgi:hypothetical protein
MITLLKQTKRIFPFAIVFSVVAVMVFQACRRHEAMDKSQPVNINAAHAWLKQDGGMFKSEADNFPLDNGTAVTGKLDWNQTISYTWNGRSYLEIPYIFNGKRKIGNDLSSFNMVIRRTKDGKSFEGALRTTTTDPNAENMISGERTPYTISAYFLPDGAPANMWVRTAKTDGNAVPAMIVVEEQVTAAMRANKSTTVPRAVMSCGYQRTVVYVPCNYDDPADPPEGMMGGVIAAMCPEIKFVWHCDEVQMMPEDAGGGFGGGGSPGSPYPPGPDDPANSDKETTASSDPCLEAAKIAALIDSLFKNANLKKAFDSIPKLGTQRKEQGFFIIEYRTYDPYDNKKYTATYYTTSLQLSENDDNIGIGYTPKTNEYIVGFVHTHPPSSGDTTRFSAPSANDAYQMAKNAYDYFYNGNILNKKTYEYMGNFVVAADGSIYALGISNFASAGAYFYNTQYSYLDGADWKKDSDAWKYFKKWYDEYENIYGKNLTGRNLSYEAAMAATLNYLGAGVTILKYNPVTGAFEPTIKSIQQQKDANGKEKKGEKNKEVVKPC